MYPFVSRSMGAVDFDGKLVVEDSGLPSLWPVGSGDMWNVLLGDKSLGFPSIDELLTDGYEYLQVLGTSNALEKCFDCFALGLVDCEGLDWTAKVVESF